VKAFFDAVEVFFHHLAAVQWPALGIALALHVSKLLFRALAWRNILRASYPEQRIPLRTVFGAYMAGVGINSIAPARGGDVVKLVLVKKKVPDTRYPTLASTLIVETVFDFFVASALMIWALSIGVLPTHQVYSRLPSVDWRFFLDHYEATLVGITVLALAGVVVMFWARSRVTRFRERVRLGFAILRDPVRFVRQVLLWQAVSWFLRIAALFFFLKAFQVEATIHNALLVQVVESLATLFPATPGGAGTKQGLLIYLFKGKAISRTLLLSFSVGMNIAIVICNVVLGFAAILIMTGSLSWRRLRSQGKTEAETAP
jgi:glycosyltransferase 2 family protein